MAVFLTLGIIQLALDPASSLLGLVPMFVLQMMLGGVLGYGMGKLLTAAVNHVHLEYQGLYPVLTVALVLLVYGATTSLGGNGFLAVYLAGLVMGNSNFVHKRSLTYFHDGLAWLMQITMFLTLGLLVFPSQLVPVIGIGMLTALFLIVVARPLSVFITLMFAKMSLNEKLLVAWIGLRGAVPIILATFPLLAGVPRADVIFNLVFFIVLASVVLQGTTLPVVARWLGLTSPPSATASDLADFVPRVRSGGQVIELQIPSDASVVGKSLMELNLPQDALVVLIHRGDDSIVPSGSTVVRADDRLLVLTKPDMIQTIRMIIETA